MAEKLAGLVQPNLQRYNDRFDSGKQMASLLEKLDGRGNSLGAQVLGEKLEGYKHGVGKTEIAPSAHDYFDFAAKLRKDLLK